MLLLIGVWIFFMRQMQGGGRGGAFSFGKSKARMLDEANNSITFADVAGCDEAKEEVAELVEFLRDPSKFQKLGGRIPRGVLMVGSPGTGKTLLAKAIAGEAKVPFFSISGSDFVEMFVGVGAARVRDMFEQAKKNAPCIVFIDEIDAVGRQRGAGLGGGNDEREQTLNQLLVEMDGFEGNAGVIVIAATNRPDVLDPALMRPGRFDRQVVVPLPDIRGREQILLVHMRKVPMSPDVKADIIARGTPGMSGADLANLVNEAALFAARSNKRLVDMHDFERAKDKIIMGAERRSIVMPEEERRNTAYHESGHAIVARLLPKTDPVHKVTIIPRGRALGVTMQLPEQDRYSMDRNHMLNMIAVLFGGRIAEELFMNQMTTGASNDFERATEIARNMVTRYGMSDELGPMVYGENEGEIFLGRSVTTQKNVSESTMQKVDEEIRKIIDSQYAVARKLLEDNRDKVEVMAKALLEMETIDADQIDDIMAGRPVRPPKPTHSSSGPSSGGSRRRRIRRRRRIPRRTAGTSVETGRAAPRLCCLKLAVPAVRTSAGPSRGRRSWASSTSRPTPSPTAGATSIRRARSTTRGSCSPTARTSSTSAANRRGPGAAPVSEAEELERVLPAGRGARRRGRARQHRHDEACRDAGGDRRRRRRWSTMSARCRSAARSRQWRASDAAVCLMHMQGEPRTMQADAAYDDVVREVRDFLVARAHACEAAGIARDRIVIDPGFGFGKTVEHNLALLREPAPSSSPLGYPVARRAFAQVHDRPAHRTRRRRPDGGQRRRRARRGRARRCDRARARRARDRGCAQGLDGRREERPMIRKLKSGEYRLYSRKVDAKTGKRRNLGTFSSRAAAEKHERAVQYFKRRG